MNWLSFFSWIIVSLILVWIFYVYMYNRASKTNKQLEHQFWQLKETINNYSTIKMLVFYWLDIHQLELDDDVKEEALKEILEWLKDKEFRNKFRNTFWFPLYNIVAWLEWQKNEFVSEVEREDKKFFEEDELRTLKTKIKLDEKDLNNN